MSTTDNSQTQIQQHIAAARARAADMIARANAQAAEEANARQAEWDAGWRQNLEWLAQWLPAWALEYVERDPYNEDYGTKKGVWDDLTLPGCCPIQIRHNGPRLNSIRVLHPMGVEHLNEDNGSKPGWFVHVEPSWSAANFDLAIDDAAQHGESYAAMLAEAERRNAAAKNEDGSHAPAIDENQTPHFAPIDQARALISMLSNSQKIKVVRLDATNDDADASAEDNADERTLVLASVGIAIAYELSRIADAIETQ